MKKKVVLVVGHSLVLQGAGNSQYQIEHKPLTEYVFNEYLAKKIMHMNKKANIEIVIEYRDTDYEALPSEVNEQDGDLVISMHCNAFNSKAEGCEVLYYEHTKISDQVAAAMNESLNTMLGNTNRGIKPRDHDRSKGVYERGAYLMKYVKAPCVICEPFFIDNDDEVENALKNMDKLALGYLQGIESSLKIIS